MLSDHVQFAGTVIPSVGIVIGSYFFVLTSPGAAKMSRGPGGSWGG